MGGLHGLCFLPTLASRQLGVCPGTSPSQGPSASPGPGFPRSHQLPAPSPADTCVPLPVHIHTGPGLCEGAADSLGLPLLGVGLLVAAVLVALTRRAGLRQELQAQRRPAWCRAQSWAQRLFLKGLLGIPDYLISTWADTPRGGYLPDTDPGLEPKVS